MPRYVDMSGWDSYMKDMLDSRNMYDHYDNGYTDAMDRVDDWIDEQPTVDPESLRPHGRWIPFKSVAAGDIWYCSACGVGYDRRPGFCPNPNCGAKMDEEE